MTNPLMNQWKTLENPSFQYNYSIYITILSSRNSSKRNVKKTIISLVSIIDSLTGLSQHFQRQDNPL